MADEVKTEAEVMAAADAVMDREDEERALIERKALAMDSIVMLTWQAMQLHDLHSCVLGSRVAFDVCRAHSIPVRVVSTHVRIFNEPLANRMRNGQVPRTVQEIEEWNEIDGSWNVGIGGFGYDQPGKYDGHIVVVADERVLLDTTLAQANRPQYGINLSGMAGRVPDGWPRSGDTVQTEQNGCVVTYEPQDDKDRRWVLTDSWRVRELREPVLRFVLAAVESALGDV